MPSGVDVFVILVLVGCGVVQASSVEGEPYKDILNDPNFRPKPEKAPNMTIDQAIVASYGGLDIYMSDNFLDPSGEIMAELDMMLKPEQFRAMFMSDDRRKKRKATRPLVYRWTDNTIPYEFITSHFNADEIYYIKKAMARWQETTCLKFRPATSSDRNRIRFQNGRGCNSLLGMSGGTQPINLEARGCRFSGLYLHEIGHAIGLVHEHQLPDRDKFIYIIYNNVAPSMRIWFNKYSTKEVNQYGVPYEYSSVMHYGVTAFSKDGSSQTIRAKDRSREAEIGRVYLKGLSFSDIKVVNKMYQCNKHCAADASCKEPAYLDKNCQCVRPSGGGGGGTTPKPGSCTNDWNDGECNGWAQQGECDANPLWMKVNCKKSCNTCDGGGGGGGVKTTTTPEPGACVNKFGDQQCEEWAARGECDKDKNPIWMRKNCKKACGCGGGNACLDVVEHCPSWAKSGYCATNMYTKTNCKKSCNLCESSWDDSNKLSGGDDENSGMTLMTSLPMTILTALIVTRSYL